MNYTKRFLAPLLALALLAIAGCQSVPESGPIEAEELAQRISAGDAPAILDVRTPQEYATKEIWVDAFPRTRHEATNFQRAMLRLNRENFHPIALRIYDPGDTFASYEFSKIVINDRWEGLKNIFAPPKVPFGYRKVVELPPEATATRPAAPGAPR